MIGNGGHRESIRRLKHHGRAHVGLSCIFAAGVVALLALSALPSSALAAASDFTREQAVAYAESLVGSKHDFDNNGSYDCVDIAKLYYSYLGEEVERGNAYTYTTGHLPDGWARVYSDPEPGDVAAWGSNSGMSSYGHVGVVVDTSGSKVGIVDQSTSQQRAARVSYYNSEPDCYLRPNFRTPWGSHDHNPVGYLDGAWSEACNEIKLSGWAYDPDEPGSPLELHVYVGGRSPETGGIGPYKFVTNATRTVDAGFGVVSGPIGFHEIRVPSPGGNVPIYVYAINVGEGWNNTMIGEATVSVDTNHNPVGYLDGAWSEACNEIKLSGWAYDPDEPGSPLELHVYVGGRSPETGGIGPYKFVTNATRTVDAGFGVVSGPIGFHEIRVPSPRGNVPIYVYAINVGEGWNNTMIGEATVSVEDATGPEVPKDGWVNLADGAKGYAKGGRLVTGWMDLGSSKYWFHDDGAMATGWADVVVDGKEMHYYFNPASGNLVRNTWFQIDGKAYYFRPSGNLATGWATISDSGVDKKYYFEEDGTLVAGCWRDIDAGNGYAGHYYFRPSGSMATGWATIDGQSYWFRPSGNMATRFTTVDDGFKRYFDESGHMLVGWQVIDGRTFYFRASGAMQTGRATIDGKVYEFTDNGTLSSVFVASQSEGDTLVSEYERPEAEERRLAC